MSPYLPYFESAICDESNGMERKLQNLWTLHNDAERY